MDALSHNLEAYCAPAITRWPRASRSRHAADQGVAARAVSHGADLEARSHMLIASSMGATAFQKGLGAMHSLSHPCSANLGSHHGLTNAV